METKISSAQIEVWDWKDTLFNELKSIPKLDRLKYINNKVSKTLAQIKNKKAPRSYKAIER